ncbi:MAG: hypothetical protein ACKO3W_03715, partial [bacterium]
FGANVPYVGAMLSAMSPLNILYATVDPANAIRGSIENVPAARTSLVVGTVASAIAFGAICFAMHASMKKSFMMTVRRLAGTS